MHPCMQSEAGKYGPWGGNEGSPWDISETKGITEIKIYYGDAIYGLVITYVIDGQPETLTVGSTIGESKQVHEVNEYFNSISGFYGAWKEVTVIKQLTLATNKGRHVPLGTKHDGDLPFPYAPPPLPPPPPYKIVGFHGRASNTAIDAIGIYCHEKN
ncbi:hypothetical protein BHM03_00043931 [Ensete ventricosum]|nr:hypothetical protein BHM03_00043931 [Ensete ventricosum]